MSNIQEQNVLTPEQIRGARAMLGWSASDLAQRTGLSRRTVQNLESNDFPGNARLSSVLAIKSVFETAGIEFIGTPEDGPGIRIRTSDR